MVLLNARVVLRGVAATRRWPAVRKARRIIMVVGSLSSEENLEVWVVKKIFLNHEFRSAFIGLIRFSIAHAQKRPNGACDGLFKANVWWMLAGGTIMEEAALSASCVLVLWLQQLLLLILVHKE